jgi:arsenate reductase (thioredoxin)
MRRRPVVFLCALVALAAFQGIAQEIRKTGTPPKPQVILFVCEHGSAKSVIAAAHFNRLASEKGLPFHAVTRGVNPDQEIPPTILRGLAADGLDVTSWKPQKVGDADVVKANRVITIACFLSATRSTGAVKVTEWNDIPNVSDGYEAARKTILDRVTELLNSLAKE